jgi:hypothetical protein
MHADSDLEMLKVGPPNWALLLELADRRERAGRGEEAEALRWMADRRKRPYGSSERGLYTWFNAGTIVSGLGDPESDLPAAVFSRLKGGALVANHRSYRMLWDACEDCVAARVAARRAGVSVDVPSPPG